MYFFEERMIEKDRTLLISNQGELVTYGEMDEVCEEMGRHMKPRTLVFLLCQNTSGSILGYLAFLRNRVVPLLLDAKMDEEMLKELIRIYEPDYIYCPKERRQFQKEEDIEEVFCGYGYTLLHRNNNTKTLLWENLALLLTTSGSTGSPKLVRQSYENIQSNADSIAKYLDLDSEERPITTLPMNYTYGLSVINSHILSGATLLLTEQSLFEEGFWTFFKKYKATSFGGVPFTYEMLKRIHFQKMDLPSLKTMTQAGGKLPKHLQKELAEYARKKGKQFIVMYGQTEATARMTYLPAEYSLEKIGSIGIPIPGGKIDIVDGELVYSGKNVTLGYAQKKDDLAKGDEKNGILYTGDMTRKDEDGFYYIVGRKKRFLKLLGSRINLDEIEQLLKAEYKDVLFACVGKDDQLKIYVEERNAPSCQEVSDFLSAKIKMNPRIFKIITIPTIPVNESGKISYKKLEGIS